MGTDYFSTMAVWQTITAPDESHVIFLSVLHVDLVSSICFQHSDYLQNIPRLTYIMEQNSFNKTIQHIEGFHFKLSTKPGIYNTHRVHVKFEKRIDRSNNFLKMCRDDKDLAKVRLGNTNPGASLLFSFHKVRF